MRRIGVLMGAANDSQGQARARSLIALAPDAIVPQGSQNSEALLKETRSKGDAQQWASAVISLIEIAAVTSELATAKMTEINKTKRLSIAE
jgi:hypothetical protein